MHLNWLRPFVVLLSVACCLDLSCSSAGAAHPCGRYIDAGGQPALACCGAPSEIPGVTCVDLSQDGGQYGFYGHCIAGGDEFEGKIAGARCCPGLVNRHPEIESDAGFQIPWSPGCAWAATPSIFMCLACGNGICERPNENHCDCPEDCPLPSGG
jgi:hypothetical protein